MLARKSFQYRLHLTKKQAKLLQEQLDECRWLYNELLERRKTSHETLGISISKYEQQNSLPALKETRISLSRVHSQVLQNVNERLDKAFQAFFRRCKAGEKPGFPRFRGVDRYKSFCYPQSGFSLVGSELKLSKIGCLSMKLHRPVQGEIKTCTLRRNSSGDWTVSFSCEVNVEPHAPKEEAVGIDVGLTHFAVLSNGKKIPNPRFFKQGEKVLAKVQRKLATLKKGSVERQKQRKVVTVHIPLLRRGL